MTSKKINLDKLEELFKPLSPEEQRLKDIETFKSYEQNPNNFSFWFEPLSESLKSEFLVPKSAVAKMHDDLMIEMVSDQNHQATMKLVQKFIQDTFKDFLEEHNKVFMKSGVFSNKFEFQHCLGQDMSKLGMQFFDMYYTSMVYGANRTREIVLREFVDSKENVGTIYNGMPLHTEFRAFYDFDNHELLDVVNYWHPEEMKPALRKNIHHIQLPELSDEEYYHKVKKVYETFKEKETLSRQEEYLFSKIHDFISYMDNEERILAEFNKNKPIIKEKVSKALQSHSHLKGQWSIDIMKNGDDFWFIDAAIMQESALAGYIGK